MDNTAWLLTTLMRTRSVFFFFQAEDGIRDLTVTGVQTCALPISVAGTLQLWMQGNYRALRNEAAKSAFIEFVPGLIDGLAHAEDPDDAVTAFEDRKSVV